MKQVSRSSLVGDALPHGSNVAARRPSTGEHSTRGFFIASMSA
jgi:hypothetical protein